MMKFSPLKFQGTLAAAGVSLMPYIFLKVNLLKSEKEISFSFLSSLSGSLLEYLTALFLTMVMLLFVIIHFTLTAIFLKELFMWLSKSNEFKGMLKNPLSSSALFSPLISLPMTMIVLFGPVSFFVPQLITNMQELMFPAFVVFCLLWVALVSLETTVIAVGFTRRIEYRQLTFGWLLDALAFGAVSLFGSSLLSFSTDIFMYRLLAVMVAISISIGIMIFAIKLIILFYQQKKSSVKPGDNVLPAYFLTIPPMCLLGFSFYKTIDYAGKFYSFDGSGISLFAIVFSYLAAISLFVFLIVLLREYLKTKFLFSDFSHAQWGIV